jgi:hypothetical protein
MKRVNSNATTASQGMTKKEANAFCRWLDSRPTDVEIMEGKPMTKKEVRAFCKWLYSRPKDVEQGDGRAYVLTVKDETDLDIYSNGDFEDRAACVGSALDSLLSECCNEDELKQTCVNLLHQVSSDFAIVIHDIISENTYTKEEASKILKDFAKSI